MLVVADASPLILLARLDSLELLPQLFDRIVAPREVLLEVAGRDSDLPGSTAVRQAAWLEAHDLDSDFQPRLEAILTGELDTGEAAAIALAASLGADLLLIDERQGRRVARRLGLEVKGTIGVLVEAKRRGLIDQLQPVLGRLRDEGAWITEDLFREALRAAGEDLETPTSPRPG